MPIIKVRGMAYVRLSAPDLDLMETFLLDFGLQVAERTVDRLYSRGIGPDHHIHITHKGPPGFLGFAYKAASEEDLHTLSREAPGASAVEDRDEPGGGKRVRLVEPNGFTIEVVHGMAPEKAKGWYLKSITGPARRARRWGQLGSCAWVTACWRRPVTWKPSTGSAAPWGC